MKTVLKITLGIVLGSILLFAGCAALIGGTADDSKPGTQVSQATDETASTETTAPAKPKAKAPAKPKVTKPELTAGQENAIGSAENYLSLTAFSRSGLIDQLKFEGYSAKDATFGVDSQKADWNKQAALKAEEYLDMSPFSRSGLVEQLEFEGFSRGQAEYGVAQSGL